MSRVSTTLLLIIFLQLLPLRGEDLTVLEGWQRFANVGRLFHESLNRLAFRYLEKREQEIDDLQTAEDWLNRQASVIGLLEGLADLPSDKTPLNARTLERIEGEGFFCEKLIFESFPDFVVTGALFVPDSIEDRRPALLYLSGHSYPSFRSPHYQRIILNLVRKGFIVLAIDPIGQGEMIQYPDPFTGSSRFNSPTGEHSYFSNQCFISGSSGYRYFVWNGIRAIDYLVSRSEVDPERIGVTGLSGGGFQTAQIAALDSRVMAAAPAAYISSWRRFLEWRGPGDGEQNLNQGIRHGIDYGDLLLARAPRPTLIVATTEDFVPFQGTRETYQEARRVFAALGHPENLEIATDGGGHGYTRKNREAIYEFFQHALNLPGSPVEEEVQLLSRDELKITPTGQVGTSFQSHSVFSLNRKLAEKKLSRLEQSRRSLKSHLRQLPSRVREISGYVAPATEEEDVLFMGRYRREGYVLEKYVLVDAEEDPVPLLLFLPAEPGPLPALLYLHPEGKSAEAAPSGEIEYFVQEGYAVAAPDLAGTGELGSLNNGLAYLGVHLGRSIPAFQAASVVRVRQFLEGRSDIDCSRIAALARGELSPALLHAALFDPVLQRLALIEPLVSYRSVVMNRHYTVPFWLTVPNVLNGYDLPDLAASLAPRKLWMVEIQDQLGRRTGSELVEREMAVVKEAYGRAEAGAEFEVLNMEPFDDLKAVLSGWLW